MPLIPAGPVQGAAQSVPRVPAVIAAPGPTGTAAFIEFFAATLRNPNTRLA